MNRPKGLKYKKHKENPTSFKEGAKSWNTGKRKEDYPQLSNSGRKKSGIPWKVWVGSKCVDCEKDLTSKSNRCWSCFCKSRKGSNHPNWIEDRTQIIGRHNRNLHDPEYKQWRKNVCNRDEWKCKILNSDCKGRLEVHHILGWKDHPELRYEVNNGITLCHFHHPRKRKDEVRLSPYFQELIKV